MKTTRILRKILIGLVIALGGLTVLVFGAGIALYIVNAGDYEVAATTADDPSLRVIELGGYRFHGETFGDPTDPVVIALHGGPGGDYRSILPLRELAETPATAPSAPEHAFFVIFYDQRGAGLSPRVPDADLTVDRYVADLDLFVEAFSPDRPVILIGHSWGAMLATVYIGRHPEKVERAVLAEPGFYDDAGMRVWNERVGLTNMRPDIRVGMAMVTAWAESLHVDGPDADARGDYLMNRFFTTPMEAHPLGGYYPDGDIQNAAGEMWRFGARAGRTVQASGLDGEGRLMDLAAGVHRWPGRALFLSGSENVIIGPEWQRSQMRRFADARLVVIEGAGHTMIGEKPAESLAVIREFLSE